MSRRRRGRSNRPFWFLILVASVAILVGLHLMGFWGGTHKTQETAAQAQAPVAIGGSFALQDSDGKAVTDQDYRGKFMLIYFGYTFCPDACPTELGLVAKAYDALTPEQQDKIVPLFITVDPDRDTAAVMKTYTQAFHPKIIGLTGTPDQVEVAKKAYKVYAAKVPGADDKNYAMDHSSVLYLMGPDGAYQTYFGRNATLEQIIDELRRRLG